MGSLQAVSNHYQAKIRMTGTRSYSGHVLIMTVNPAPIERLHIYVALLPRAMNATMIMVKDPIIQKLRPPLATKVTLDNKTVVTEARMATHRAITTLSRPRSPEEEANPRIETLAASMLDVRARTMTIDRGMIITSATMTAPGTEVAIVRETAPGIVREIEGTGQETGQEIDPGTVPEIEIEIASTTAIVIVDAIVIVTKTVIVIVTVTVTVIVTVIATATAILDLTTTVTTATTIATITGIDRTRLSEPSTSQVP